MTAGLFAMVHSGRVAVKSKGLEHSSHSEEVMVTAIRALELSL
jgi:hypothetical protein